MKGRRSKLITCISYFKNINIEIILLLTPSGFLSSSRLHDNKNSIFQEPPRFTVPLRDQCVDDGDKVVFHVQFRGNPRPTITWYFNSQPIKPSADFQINVDFQRQESTLTVVEVRILIKRFLTHLYPYLNIMMYY